jgi:hypothetical protein
VSIVDPSQPTTVVAVRERLFVDSDICVRLQITCPAGGFFTINYDDGSFVSAVYNGAIILRCGVDVNWYNFQSVADDTDKVVVAAYCSNSLGNVDLYTYTIQFEPDY